MNTANLKVKISKEELDDILHNVLKEHCVAVLGKELPKIILNIGKKLIEDEIEKILEPIVLKTLTGSDFDFMSGYHSYKNKGDIDSRIACKTREYLNRPSYIYSKSETTPSKRYLKSSDKSSKSLIEFIIEDKIKKLIDDEYLTKFNSKVEEVFKNQDVIKNLMSGIVKKELLKHI
jgi:hypothetical protein